ncbi:hypothetical protein [Modestobacter sp. NPDC049651]|uniref:hypothetical protein n=1 Tax=unclassified Modestobacter TaxID=2643866 RepID=UPI00340221A4
MSEADDLPDTAILPDTAMATGNDEGDFGPADTSPLAKDERRLLEKLQKPGKGEAEPAVEDSPEVATAVAEGTLLPGGTGGGNDDGLDARFTDR